MRVSITDTGLGIREKDKGKLFKLFGSIKDEKKKINTQGIGLGLVISKLIVNKFNGVIDFLSKYKKGSTFFFTFQLDQFSQQQVIEEQQNRERDGSLAKSRKTEPLPEFRIMDDVGWKEHGRCLK